MHAREQHTTTFDPTAPQLRPFPGARSWLVSNPWIYIGSIAGVKKAKRKAGCLICPLDADPLVWRWPAEGLEITVITDDDKVKPAMRLVQALIRDKAQRVVCIAAPSGHATYHAQHEPLVTLE